MTTSDLVAHDPALTAQRALPTENMLLPQAIEWMLIAFAHDVQLFGEARQLIAPHHFHANELPLQLAWNAMCEATDSHGGFSYENLSFLISQQLQQDQTIVLQPQQMEGVFSDAPDGLIYNIVAPTTDMTDVNISFARELLKRFAYERTIVEPLRRVMNPGFNQGVPSDIGEFLEVINQQQSRLTTMHQIPQVDMAPQMGTPFAQSSIFKLTGIPFIDEALGGQRVGDANGLIGPTGGGKTTLAVHMAVAGAQQAWAEAQENNTASEVVVYITAEEAAIKLRPRIWSAFFKMPREKLETMTDWGQLTQPGRLDEYEMRMQADLPYALSETERYQLQAPQLQRSLITLDLSGSEEFPDAGQGHVDEQVSYLSRIAQTQQIRTVFIDYAGLVCERHMQAMGMDESNYRRMLKTFGDRCRKEIAERFGCTVWILHQLKGGVGTASPLKLMHHTDAAESKDFAVNLAVCGCLGVPDVVTGCRRLNWSKVRYLPGEKIAPPTLKIDERFAVMKDVTSIYTLDAGGRQFITREDQQQVQGLPAEAQSGPPGLVTTTATNLTQRPDI